MRKLAAYLLIITVFVITSCGSSRSAGGAGKVYDKKAVACYYADKFNGKKTASGEKFSNSKYTAAHKKLAFGTKVRVTNLKNSKSVVVTINDRGPFSRGRDIDLSKKAFMEITDNKNHGEITVKIEILK
ncbi:MAG: septal ring lytic transglycosylase RlpA family protein [Flavobacterium sp.]